MRRRRFLAVGMATVAGVCLPTGAPAVGVTATAATADPVPWDLFCGWNGRYHLREPFRLEGLPVIGARSESGRWLAATDERVLVVRPIGRGEPQGPEPEERRIPNLIGPGMPWDQFAGSEAWPWLPESQPHAERNMDCHTCLGRGRIGPEVQRCACNGSYDDWLEPQPPGSPVPELLRDGCPRCFRTHPQLQDDRLCGDHFHKFPYQLQPGWLGGETCPTCEGVGLVETGQGEYLWCEPEEAWALFAVSNLERVRRLPEVRYRVIVANGAPTLMFRAAGDVYGFVAGMNLSRVKWQA